MHALRIIAFLLTFTLLGCSHARSDASEALRKRAERKLMQRYDEPGAAAAYYEMKHAGAEDRFAKYEAARAQIALRTQLKSTQTRPLAWRHLGPGNIGGRTRTLVIDPIDNDIMYTGGVSGGVWKSWDGGQRWKPVSDELANIAINSMAMDPRDRNTIYVGTGEGYFREEVRGTGLPLRGNGMFVTRDGGATWTHIASTINSDFHWVNDLTISRHDPQRIYAATRTGVWRTSDAGGSWSNVVPVTAKGGCLDLAVREDASADYLFASCGTLEQATVYRATNAETDAEWSVVLREPNMGRTSLAIAPSRPSTIYALSASNQSGNFNQGLLAVFRSDSNGDEGSWRRTVRNTDAVKLNTLLLTNPLAALNRECANADDFYVTMGWYCNVIAVDPVDHERVWAAGVDLFRSDDGGARWGVASYWWARGDEPSFAHADHHAIVFHPRYDGTANQTMYSANDGGIFRTGNARSPAATGDRAGCSPNRSSVRFASLSNDLGVTQFYNGAVFPSGSRFIAGAQDNGTVAGELIEGTNGWRHLFGGDGGYVAVA
ncbi:MAG: hypothetical protein JJE51_09615, partial [Thermoanaerobaculia bacterium]|nr:hypothetical protein [Thermoanaerobaculia bacterium]